ncbi:MAG: hypothetical protein GVX78_00770, partial [Bacteroidetes bacterium]|nr:hypothetical protein [Bacteroidota bacterium]
VSILDPEQGLVSEKQTITITSTAQIDLSNIRVCDQAAVFFQLNVDTFDRFYAPPQSLPYLTGNNSSIVINGSQDRVEILTDEIISNTGSYESPFHYFFLRQDNNAVNYFKNSPADLSIEITEYSDTPGEFVGGSFMGSVSRDSTGLGTPVDISGAFRIEVR